jgi:hypothetical protein
MELYKSYCLLVVWCWKDNNTTPFSLGSSNTFSERYDWWLSNRNHRCRFIHVFCNHNMLYEMLYEQQKIISCLHPDLLLSCRYHQNINNFRSAYKWSEAKDWHPWVHCLWMRGRRSTSFDMRLLCRWEVFMVMKYKNKYNVHSHYSSCTLSLLKGKQF